LGFAVLNAVLFLLRRCSSLVPLAAWVPACSGGQQQWQQQQRQQQQ
jgi:outer membrane biogenesis lipoprotein LolB